MAAEVFFDDLYHFVVFLKLRDLLEVDVVVELHALDIRLDLIYLRLHLDDVMLRATWHGQRASERIG